MARFNWEPNRFSPGATVRVRAADAGRSCIAYVFGPQTHTRGKWEVYNEGGEAGFRGRFVGSGEVKTVAAGKRAAEEALDRCLRDPHAGEPMRMGR